MTSINLPITRKTPVKELFLAIQYTGVSASFPNFDSRRDWPEEFKTIGDILDKPDAAHTLGLVKGFQPDRVALVYGFLAKCGLTPQQAETQPGDSGKPALTRASGRKQMAGFLEQSSRMTDNDFQKTHFAELAALLRSHELPPEFSTAGQIVDNPKTARDSISKANPAFSMVDAADLARHLKLAGVEQDPVARRALRNQRR